MVLTMVIASVLKHTLESLDIEDPLREMPWQQQCQRAVGQVGRREPFAGFRPAAVMPDGQGAPAAVPTASFAAERMFDGPGLSIGRMNICKVQGRSGRKLQ